eukprot:6184803-Pleurochrysis_carterae.AAC.2
MFVRDSEKESDNLSECKDRSFVHSSRRISRLGTSPASTSETQASRSIGRCTRSSACNGAVVLLPRAACSQRRSTPQPQLLKLLLLLCPFTSQQLLSMCCYALQCAPRVCSQRGNVEYVWKSSERSWMHDLAVAGKAFAKYACLPGRIC